MARSQHIAEDVGIRAAMAAERARKVVRLRFFIGELE
jgi:hypothetical protein